MRLAGFLLVLATLVPPAQAVAQRRGRPAAPRIPPPTIVEYEPRSTLVVPEHEVPRARFPAVDLHGPPTLDRPAAIDRVVEAMDQLNLQVMVQARGSSGARLTKQIEAVRAAGHADRFVFFTRLDLRNVGPGSGARIAAQLEADVAAGAVGIGEIGKGFGLSTRKADGTRLEMDDPELDIVWETAARLGIPVFVHTGDPAEFFELLDFQNERACGRQERVHKSLGKRAPPVSHSSHRGYSSSTGHDVTESVNPSTKPGQAHID